MSEHPKQHWTMKRLLQQMTKYHNVPRRVHDSSLQLGRAMDFWLSNPEGHKVVDAGSYRWSTDLDFARMVILMFGTPEARAEYHKSKQFPERERLDDTTRLSVKAEYWVDLSILYNDPDIEVDIDVGNDLVNIYLRSKLSTAHRVSWPANKLRENFRRVRADYESSREYRNFEQSGQNDGSNFYPDFQVGNPSHVLLHYYLIQMPRGCVLGDMPKHSTIDTGGVEQPIDLRVTPEQEPKRKRPRRASQKSQRTRLDFTPSTPATSVSSHSTGYSTTANDGSSHKHANVSEPFNLANVMGTFNEVCTNLISKVSAMDEQTPRHSSSITNVCESSSQVLRLMDTKKELLARLRGMHDDPDADEDDKTLLQMLLTKCKDEIKSHLSF